MKIGNAHAGLASEVPAGPGLKYEFVERQTYGPLDGLGRNSVTGLRGQRTSKPVFVECLVLVIAFTAFANRE